MKKVAEILPEFIDDDDVKTIDDAIDDIAVKEKRKRGIFGGGIDRPKRRKIIKIIFKVIVKVVFEVVADKLVDLVSPTVDISYEH